MIDQRILQKAIDSGFKYEHKGLAYYPIKLESVGDTILGTNRVEVFLSTEKDKKFEEYKHKDWHSSGKDNFSVWTDIECIIFDHDFAKAIWPNDKEDNIYWKRHLQNMVISDNPIKYLEENI